MLGRVAAGSSTRAEAGRPGPVVDRRTSWQEADSSSTEEGVGRRPLAAVGLGVPRPRSIAAVRRRSGPCSIAVVRRLCMELAVSGHRCMTFFIQIPKSNFSQ